MKFDEDDSLAIHVALDNVIVISEISKFLNYSRILITYYIWIAGNLCVTSSSSDFSKSNWKPLLLIVPLRLGLSDINSIYAEGLKVLKCYNLIS